MGNASGCQITGADVARSKILTGFEYYICSRLLRYAAELRWLKYANGPVNHGQCNETGSLHGISFLPTGIPCLY